MRTSALALAAALAVVSSAAPARAQRRGASSRIDPRTAEAKRLFEDGAAAYAKGNYDEAIKLWEKSYDISKKPLIFENLANAYERLGDARKARDYLKRWREVAPRDEWDLLDARIANLDARVKREEELDAQRKAEEEKAKREQAAREAALRQQLAAPPPGPPLPAIAMMGVGGAAVLVGLTFDVIAGIRRPDAKTACAKETDGTQLCRTDDASAITSSNTFATVGDVTWIAGAAVASVGAVWFFWKRGQRAPVSDAGPAAELHVAPSFGARGGGLSLAGTF